MQGDWWSQSISGRQGERFSKYASPPSTWATPSASTSKATTPKIVTLTVQPLLTESSSTSFRHCNHNHVGISSAENILAQAQQRRKRLNMKQKALFYGKRPLSMGPHSERQDTLMDQCDLTWSNFFESRLATNSTNSPYGGQEVNSTTSSSGQPTSSSTNKDVNRHASSDDFRSLERKLEKERERRTHVDISPPRIESKDKSEDKDKSPEKSPELRHSSLARIRFRRLSLIDSYEDPGPVPYRSPKSSVLGEDIPTMDLSKSNSFRSNKKEILFSRSQQQQQSIHKSPSYRNTAVRSNNVGPSSSSATLRGHSIGFGSRDPQSLRSPTHRERMRGSMVIPHGHGNERLRRSKYQYPDPVAGCIPAFQQRLSELSSLESDTIRYERAKRSKKKAKQDKE